MEEELFPVSDPFGEEGMNEGMEVENREEEETVYDSDERTTGLESRTESERQLDVGQERWRDDGAGSLADDEDEYEDDDDDDDDDDEDEEEEDDDDDDDDDNEDDDDDDDGHGMSFAFTPLVKIVRKTAEIPKECHDVRADDVRADDVRADDISTHLENTKQSPQRRCVRCGEMMSSLVFLLAGVVMFPLLVWGGHDLLPLELPAVRSAPSRLVYTLRCALFATFPIILGVLVHGVSRLKFSSLNPLFKGKRVNRHTRVHMTYVQDSLRLFLLFFVQLAVMSTYIHHEALKLIPLLTIVFVFGRLIYWPSVCFGSSVRVLGFSLSFMPVLALMGLNLYFICSSTGEGAVFDVAPPTTAPPPKARWWG